jgi:outer membrane protein W
MIGPYLSARISDKARFDIKSFVGVGHVNDPVFSAEGITVDEQWSTAVALQIGGNLRYYFSGDWCLLVSIDYNHMKPSFKVPQGDGNDISASQNISSLAMNAGIGIRF